MKYDFEMETDESPRVGKIVVMYPVKWLLTMLN